MSDNVILNLNSHAELVSASPIVANDGRFRNEFGMTDKSTSYAEQDNVTLNLIQDLTPNGIDTLPSPEFVNSQGSLTNSTLSHSRTLWARGFCAVLHNVN